MKSKSLVWMVAGVLLLAMCIAVMPVSATVSVFAEGSASYYFGEQPWFRVNVSPNNHQYPYMFMTGPGLPSQGAAMNGDPASSPVTNGSTSSFTRATLVILDVDLGGGKSFIITQYDWDMTDNMADALDAGTYIVYGETQPLDLFHVGLPGNEYGTVSIILKRPFISATGMQSHIPIGSVFTINGCKEGAKDMAYFTMTNNTGNVIIGSLPVEGVKPEDLSIVSTTGNGATFGSTSINTDCTFSYAWNTNTLAGGSLLPGTNYAFVASNHPLNIPDQLASHLYSDMYTKLAVGIEGVHANITVNTISGTAPLTVAFTDYSTAIPGPLTSVGVWYDDGGVVEKGHAPGATWSHTYTSAGTYNTILFASSGAIEDSRAGPTIMVASPHLPPPEYIIIDPISDPYVGDKVSLNATTNMEVGKEVLVEIRNVTIIPDLSGATGTVHVVSGAGVLNRTIFDMDFSTFYPGEYKITETSVLDVTVFNSTTFNVLPGSAPGYIAVDSTPPGAMIYLDGVYASLVTPHTLTALSGDHTVKVTYANYFDAQRQVTVVSGATASTSIAMDAIPAALAPPVKSAVQKVIDDELHGDTRGVAVSANALTVGAKPTVNDWVGSVPFSTNAQCSLVAVNHAPGANWEHPITYYAVDAAGNTEKYDRRTPATNYQFTFAAGTDTGVGDVVWIPQDPYMWRPTCTNDCTNNYALLISGGKDADSNFVRYWNDIAFMYTNLLDYSYPKSQITVLMSDKPDMTVQDRCIAASGTTCTGKDISPLDIDGDGYSETIGPATKTNILDTLSSMGPNGAKKLPQNANLFIFTTSHGGWDQVANSDPNTNSVYMYGWGGSGAEAYVTDQEFVSKLNLLTQVSSITLVMENCNSGGFTNEFLNPATVPAGQKRVIITAANGNEYSNGNGFSNAVTTALAGRDRGLAGQFITDKNADKFDPRERVSMSEAIEYAKLIDPYVTTASGPVDGKEHPSLTALAGTDPATQFLTACTAAAPKSIVVKSPANAENLQLNTKYRIKWDATGLTNAKVKITLLKSGSPVYTIVDTPGVDATNLPYYDWTIPSNTATQGNPTTCAIKVETLSVTPTVSGTSAGTFRITAQPPVNYGALQINTVDEAGAALPGAAVVLDGVSAGTTNVNIPNVAYGNAHTLSVTLAGYYPQSTQPNVKAGTNTIPFTLHPLPKGTNGEDLDKVPYGGMDISSSPSGAKVWIGKSGSTPADTGLETQAITNLMPGEYNVYVTKDNYQQSETRTVTVEQYTSKREPVKVYFELPHSPNVAPVLGDIIVPADPDKIGEPGITVSSTVTDANTDDTFTGVWGWDDGTPNSPAEFSLINGVNVIKGTHTYTAPGVYTVNLTVTDGVNTVKKEAANYIATYDPNGGYVIGAGSIDSPVNAYALNPSMTGRAYFGFVSKYVKGKTVPQGVTEFYFETPKMNFYSTNYDWLVVDGAKATYKGTGKISGMTGDYKFVLTAVDGALKSTERFDRFRIRITDTTEKVRVYDNLVELPIDTELPATTTIKTGFIIIVKK